MKMNILYGVGFLHQPGLARSLQEGKRPIYVGQDELLRAKNGAIHMGFSSKMNDRIHRIAGEKIIYQRLVTNIPIYKNVPLPIGQILQVFQIPRIGEQIEVDHPNVWLCPEQIVNKV